MNKSDLIEAIAKKQTHLTLKVVDLAVDCIIEGLCQAAVSNERIEIRGFGAFSLHHYPARLAHLRHFLARNRLFPPFWQSKIYKTL